MNRLALACLVSLASSISVSAQPAAAPPAPAAVVSQAEIESKADAFLAAQAKVNGFSGSVLIAREGVRLYSKGFGWANAEWEIPNASNTKFRLGSITKQFTATAVLRLQEQGKLKAQDAICTYLSPCPDTWKAVTVHHLLTHTSGIPSYTGSPEYGKTMMMPKTAEQMVAGFRDLPLEFQPGERFKYNNSGYFLLGLIIEKVSGKKYEEVLRDEIFGPLGMHDSGYDWSATLIPRRAAGYQRRDGLVNAPYLDMQQPYSAGSLYSTVDDLLLWDQALYTDKVLPAAAREAMFTPFKDGYAYGWNVVPPDKAVSGKRQVGHGGGINGFSTMIARVPEDRLVVIVLGNVDNVNATPIARDLVAIAYGKPFTMPLERTAIPVTPEILSQYVGRYELTPTFILTVTLEDGRLMTQATNQPKFPIFPESETKFFLKVVDAQLTFGKDAEGTVTDVTLHQNGRDQRAKKIE